MQEKLKIASSSTQSGKTYDALQWWLQTILRRSTQSGKTYDALQWWLETILRSSTQSAKTDDALQWWLEIILSSSTQSAKTYVAFHWWLETILRNAAQPTKTYDVLLVFFMLQRTVLLLSHIQCVSGKSHVLLLSYILSLPTQAPVRSYLLALQRNLLREFGFGHSLVPRKIPLLQDTTESRDSFPQGLHFHLPQIVRVHWMRHRFHAWSSACCGHHLLCLQLHEQACLCNLAVAGRHGRKACGSNLPVLPPTFCFLSKLPWMLGASANRPEWTIYLQKRWPLSDREGYQGVALVQTSNETYLSLPCFGTSSSRERAWKPS